jgi:hypothetical protein
MGEHLLQRICKAADVGHFKLLPGESDKVTKIGVSGPISEPGAPEFEAKQVLTTRK